MYKTPFKLPLTALAASLLYGCPPLEENTTGTLTVEISGGGTVSSKFIPSIDCPEKCSATLNINSTAHLEAVPNDGWWFLGYDVLNGCSDWDYTEMGGTCSIHIDASVTVTAVFCEHDGDSWCPYFED